MTRKSVSAQERLGAFSKEKAKLLELLLQRESRQANEIRPYPRGDDAQSARLPATGAQQRLWFIDQLEGGSAAYHIPVAVRLRGELDRAVLQSVLNTLLKRHEALRTVFVEVGGEPMQEIRPDGCFALQLVDLRMRAGEDREAELLRHSREEQAAPFNLSTGPLIRGRLLQLSQEDHVLLLTMHHIVSDGWSIGVLIRELGVLYAAYRAGQPDPLTPLSIQYADYAQWQRQQQVGPQLQEQLKYWKEHLQQGPELLELPTDRPRPPVQSYQGASVRVILGADVAAGLKALSRRLNVTLAMTLYAAWSVVLSRLSGQEDIVFGMPVANRRRTELEGVVGFFVNTLAVRVRLEDDPSVADLIARVKEIMLGAYAHQDVPFEKVVEAVQPARSLSHSPIFQVMFTLQNTPAGGAQLPGLTLTEEEVPLHTAKFDLSLFLQESADGIRGSLNYASDLFDETTIQRWVGCFEVVLRAMAQESQLRISRLPLLSEAERLRVTELFNATQAPYPQEKLIHQLFEEQVERTPYEVALVCADQHLTYRQLNGRANQLARYLRRQGVSPDDFVGLCVERGVEMVVGVLGILKAGGAYVPLDPNYPQQRLEYMLKDTAPRAVLTLDRLRDRVPSATAVSALDTQWSEIAGEPMTNLAREEVEAGSGNLAYIIYTSGSTGQPKGVAIEHRSAVNLICWARSAMPAEVFEHTLHSTSLNFDLSVYECFVPLATGGCLRVVQNALALLHEPAGVTLINTVPSAIKGILDSGSIPATTRVVNLAGEALKGELVDRIFASSAVEWVCNLYGPSETTTYSTWVSMPRQDGFNSSIGHPIANTQVYILDRYGQPVPIGVVGEIHIGGAGVARGYLNRPELTAQRFLRDPFSADSQARMYRTGDLGRWRRDGTIEYLGRNDHQVKIRGFRIELGEIESQLTRHHQLSGAAVIAREDVLGEKRLVAYVVSADASDAPAADDLRVHLKEVLPDYMVPSAIVTLERLPLTPNGKLDRAALPAPQAGTYSSREYEAPQGEVEEVIAGIWRSLLHVERVGRGDNFFELGGHSLLIMQMMERLRRVGLSTELRKVYESVTLAELASSLTSATVEQFEVPPNLIPPACEAITPDMLPLVELEAQHIERIVQSVPGGASNVQDIYPLAPLQEGILFHHLLNERRGDTYILPIVLLVSSRERLDELVGALQSVIDRHDVLRTAVLWEELPRPVQVVYRHANLPVVETAWDSAREAMEQLGEWVKPELQRLDVRRAPLLRLQVAEDVRTGQWYALLQVHHVTIDHVTLEIVTAEVVAHLEGRAQTLPPSVPYRNHVAQSLAYARRHDAEAFFRGKLTEIDEPTAPFALMDVHGDGTQIEEYREEVDLGLAQRVRDQAKRLGVSAATLFHAAWALVVARTSGRDDVVFGSVLLGRLQGSAGAQRILGMFINTLPLRLQLHAVTAKGLVEQTQRELVELLSHEQASLAVAQRCSGIVGAAPLFTALFNHRHSVPNPEAEWSGASGIRMLTVQERTNYPLVLSVDDLGKGFVLTAQTDRRIDPRRITAYLHTAVQSLVEALEQSPQTPALSLSILPESERRQLIGLFNATQASYPHEKLIHQLFEEQVERTPLAVAVVYEGQSLTYAELNGRANQLARYLRDKGIGPDQLVAICVERGLEMVVGLLGILKAGGAYVPLDPGYPAERLAHMLNDAEPPVLLIQERLRGRLPQTAAEVIALDGDWKEAAEKTTSNLSSRAIGLHSDHLAYVIYTSGSTGTPKGVMVKHAGVSNYLQWALRTYALESGEAVAVSSPLAFDATVTSLYCPLLSGRAVVLVPDGRELEGLEQLLRRQTRWSLIKISPAHLHVLGQRLQSAKPPCTVGAFIIGGEALSPSTVELWRSIWPQVRLINEYGPTETVVGCSVYDVPQDWAVASSVPIGSPIANTQIYILDRHQQPVPIGVAGEIHIGGAGVARGYLNRPELTAERFLSDPFSNDVQARMYKTGDLGRWRADGAIEYLGRNDHQVKIRGFRIELGEIEAQLVRHAQLKEAVVIAREDAPGEKRLVAYVVPRDPVNAASVEELRAHLKAVLPEYMVPSAFVALEQLPLTANGKLDRRALPAPELGAYASRQYEAPRGEVEEILAGIWQSLLRVERVGRQDNFFELGGHSLLIMQMMERLRRVGLATEVRRVFESPTLTDLAGALTREAVEQFEVPPSLIPQGCEAITPQMLPLVELEPQHIERIAQSVPGGMANVQDIYPLAPLQEGILFHHLLDDEGGDTYVLATVLSVSSRERLEELIAALQSVIDRHDVLRTAVLWEQLPRAVQVVYRDATLPVEMLTLDRGRDPMEQIKEWIKPERQRLDLRLAPLMRLQVAADPNGEQWYVVLQLHHVATDHVTSEIVVAEVVAHLENRARALPASVPYRNHVAQSLAYAQTHDAEAFFRSKLGEIDEPTAPFGLLDVHGDGTQVEEAREDFALDLAQRVRAQARRLGVSAATLFHAAWGLVVAHTGGRDDVVFGSVLLGRLQGNAGAQRVLGMFMNTLPLRLRLQAVTAKELVEQTQRELVELLSHEQASLAVAQRCSGVVGSAPLFTALLNYRHSAPNPEVEWSSASGVQLLLGQERTNYPVVIAVDDLGEGFRLTAQTDRRIDPQRMTGYLHTAVRSLVEALEQSPQKAALSLSILPANEHRQVIELFNATQAPYPEAKLIHQLFEEQVERAPRAVAVVYEGQSLTYAELNRRANQLARYLRTRGVGPDQLVAICVERSLEMVVGLLGIWKAGGAYVPLDPSYPAERLAYIVKDAKPPVLLIQDRLREGLPPTAAEVIALDSDWSEIAENATGNLDSRASGLCSDHLAYVIYTSGSTGTPKGVMIQHDSVLNLWRGLEDLYHQAGSCQRVALNASFNFDASVQQFLQLLSGRTLFVIPQECRQDIAMLLGFLDEHRIDGIDCTPSQLKSWISAGLLEPSRYPLRMVLVGGEAIGAELWSRLASCGDVEIYNVYGPTECTVDATVARLRADATAPHIGRPMPNRLAYILDRSGQPAPIGIPGEIYIGGKGIGRGYLNRPELTAERFLPDPFSADPRARVYKTGDLGRWRANGTIEYLGRNDDQVKIRGYRIELGEIDAQLARHEQLKQAVVIVREDVPGDKRLVAYVVPHDASNAAAVPSVDTLRAHLKAALPEYMVPSAFVTLERLPLTPSGKIERRALPAPELSAAASLQYEAPLGEVEEIVAEIWRVLLQADRVGRHDNFFELGGHSLLVLDALFKINQSFGCNLRVTDLYKSPTVQELAICISGETTEDEFVDLSREAALDGEIVAKAGLRRIPAKAVMLTGGTGFVGRFLLAQLLNDTDATIYCLVRAQSQHQAASRLRITLAQWDLWRDEFEPRIVAVPGDLRLPRLGIDEATYQMLCKNLDSIYHCATSMNHLETYAMAKSANVDASKELLRLATRHSPKLINYLSTLSIFNPSADGTTRVVDEATPIDHEKHSASSGYIASKWVGEKIFMSASERGIPCNIFRLGLVWPDTQQGRYDELQRDYRVIKSCLLSGYGIKNYRHVMPPTAVDYAARAVVFLANRHSEGRGIFHISSPSHGIEGVFERCNEIADTSLELMSFYDWICEIKRRHYEGQSLPVVPLVEFAFSMDEQSFHEHERRTHRTGISFNCARTYRELELAGIVAPALNDDLLRACVDSMLSRDRQLQELTERQPDLLVAADLEVFRHGSHGPGGTSMSEVRDRMGGRTLRDAAARNPWSRG